MSPVEVASQKQTSWIHLARWGKNGWAYHGLATEKVQPTDGKPGSVNKTERISLAYPHILESSGRPSRGLDSSQFQVFP